MVIATVRVFVAVCVAGLAGCMAANVKPQPEISALARYDSPCATGTRIPSQREGCAATGRVYSDKDIRNTGATTAAEALRLLDPSITINR